jgi:hypothetical protein
MSLLHERPCLGEWSAPAASFSSHGALERTLMALLLVDTPPETDIMASVFTQYRPAILESLGQKFTKQSFYGINATYGDVSGFKGYLQFAQENGSDYYTACGATTSSTEIYVVKFHENYSGILLNSAMVAANELIETTKSNFLGPRSFN